MSNLAGAVMRSRESDYKNNPRNDLWIGFMKDLLIEATREWGLEQSDTLDKKHQIENDLYFFARDFLKNDRIGAFHKELGAQIDKNDWEKALIIVPRDHLKSTFITQMYTAQRILKNPDIRILVASSTSDIAKTFLSSTKNILETEQVTAMYGPQKGAKWGMDAISVRRKTNPSIKEFTVTTIGLDSQVTSQHFDLMIFDDVVNRQNIATIELIKKVIQFYKDCLSLLDKKTGQVIVLGTPWDYSDLYSHIMRKMQDQFKLKFIRSATDDGTLDGKILYPEIFTKEKLAQLLVEIGNIDFQKQYMCNMDEITSHEIDYEDFQYYNDLCNSDTYNAIITVDPAISIKKGSDYTGIVCSLVNQKGNIFVDKCIKEHMPPVEIIDKMFELQKYYDNIKNVNYVQVAIETVGFQAMLKSNAEERMKSTNYYFSITELKPKSAVKVDRIRGLQPFYKDRKIFHKTGECTALEDELVFMGKGAHPDVSDAFAYQIPFWIPTTQTTKDGRTALGKLFDEAKKGSIGGSRGDWEYNPTPHLS